MNHATVGHIHLKVADLDRAIHFYGDLLGFAVTQRYGDQAAFLGAGGYHHHIGLNTWESAGAPPPPGSAGVPCGRHLQRLGGKTFGRLSAGFTKGNQLIPLACGAKLNQILAKRARVFLARANTTNTKENQLDPFVCAAKFNQIWAKPSAGIRPGYFCS